MNLRISPVVAGTVASLTGVADAEAQSITGLRDKFFGGGGEEVVNTASAGNGGVVTAAANSGAVSAGDINSGGNVCNAIGVGNTYGYPVCGQVRLAGFRDSYPHRRWPLSFVYDRSRVDMGEPWAPSAEASALR